ncbi:PAS domain S-box protein [Thiomonas sp. FB-6]|uniref:PAS domain S-box protein n=1 Tax=Thiomonas sp. FB-6 TaxID=1158291 RepID=UPI00037EFAC0|nr:PAS domain S-box protein [Thiomonas sp. FB-6]
MAGRYGFRAAATLPIRRTRLTWAVMTILDSQTALYDQDLREQESHRRLERALGYQRRLMEKNAAGMFTLDAEGRIGDLNPALCEMLGYERGQLQGRSGELHGWWAHGGPRLGRERIHGPLGALALHWALAQDASRAPMHVDDCPVTQWLHRSGLRGEDVEAWHAAAHTAPAAWSPEQPFVRWLLQALQAGQPQAAGESAQAGAA